MNNIDVVNEFEEYLISKGRDHKTVDSHVDFIKKFIATVGEPVGEWNIRMATVVERYLNNKEYADTTYNRCNMSFRIFLSWLHTFEYNEKIDLEKFFKVFEMRKIKNKDDVGQAAMDYNKFTDFLNFILDFGKGKTSQRARTIVLLEMCAGLRRCETIGLMKSNVDSKNNVLRLEDTKYGKKRNVYVEDFVIDEIEKLSDMYPESEYVICTDKGTKVAESQINRSVNMLTTKAVQRGIIEEKVSPHGLRKSYASYLLFVKKVSPQHIQKLLGHSDPRTTQLYFKTSEDHIKDAVLGLNMRGDNNEGRDNEESKI